MLLCDGRDSSISSAATPAGTSFSWECAQHGDSSQRPAIPGGSAAQPPLRQGGAGSQLATCSVGLRQHEVAAPPHAPRASLSADAGARRQGCDRALWLRARLHTMRVHTTRELDAGQCNPHASWRGHLQQSKASQEAGSLQPVFGKISRELNCSQKNASNSSVSPSHACDRNAVLLPVYAMLGFPVMTRELYTFLK